MSEFREVTPLFWASPQIGLAEVAEAQARGIGLIINNRPEDEADDQVPGAAIEAAARAAGLEYLAIPVSPGGFTEDQVEAMAGALEQASGPVLAYCRSGTRSTLLWSLAQAKSGRAPDAIAADAASAGYDVAAIRPLLEMLAARA
jgi:uncharacterized protein (TIGR01244 family)